MKFKILVFLVVTVFSLSAFAEVKIGVLDSGVDLTHPELQGKILEGGWNYINDNSNIADDHGHGTHVTGIIISDTYGMAPKAKILPIKMLDNKLKGHSQAIIKAMRHAIQAKVKIINCSWFDENQEYAEELKQTFLDAQKAGILIVVGAGNEGRNTDMYDTLPAKFNLDNMITVAASDENNELAVFSDWGSETVHIAAPGDNIMSTKMGGGFTKMFGTSQAAPYVTAMAARLWDVYPNWDYKAIRKQILRSVRKIPSMEYKVTSGGVIDGAKLFLDPTVEVSVMPELKPFSVQNYALESIHPTANTSSKLYRVKVPGAKTIKVHFKKIDIVKGQERIMIGDSKSDYYDIVREPRQNYTSRLIPGDTVLIVVVSEPFVNYTPGWGFEIDQVYFQIP